MIVEFDIGADLIEVPEYVVENRELLRRRFIKWLYDPAVKHRWRQREGCCYRSDAFVFWLNKKVLGGSEQASVVQMGLMEWDESLPGIFF